MRLLEGVHHVTFLTEDIDRLAAFYERVFDARKTLDMAEEEYGTSSWRWAPRPSCIHSRSAMDSPLPAAPGTMFQRGRLDHFAFWAPSEDAFRELRRRLESEGRADGNVRDMKAAWIMGFHDPDGFYVEVIWHKPGVPDTETLRRADWTSVELR
jgi:catechol 2,3-dioxygenase-like lactoylglutathione lyase family enzyme